MCTTAKEFQITWTKYALTDLWKDFHKKPLSHSSLSHTLSASWFEENDSLPIPIIQISTFYEQIYVMLSMWLTELVALR